MRVSRALPALLLAAAAPAPVGMVQIDVTNVRNARGTVHVDLCPQERFLKDGCPFSGAAAAHPGTTTIVLRGIPAGRYAVQAFHDENANHKVDRALFGIPREGVGFSRDARIVMGPPSWSDAVVTTGGTADRLTFRLRYFTGPAGPPAR